jgi:tripartite-type tricarboxylate transporter receptor subunit TctC
MKQPDIAERLATLGFNAMETTPAGLSDHMQAETAKWAKVVREANIKID